MNAENQKKLVEGILGGTVYVVGEYRGSHIGERAYVDKTDGKKKSFMGATHLLEVSGNGRTEAYKLSQRVPDGVTDPKLVPVPWEKGKRYAFPINRMGFKTGTIEVGLADGESIPV
jgi:hypothetical protein